MQNSAADIAAKKKSPKKRKSAKYFRQEKERREDSLLFATDSAIDRLKVLSEPGGAIDSMDIKDLKNLISSIKELSVLSVELGENPTGGVVVLPEVKITDE